MEIFKKRIRLENKKKGIERIAKIVEIRKVCLFPILSAIFPERKVPMIAQNWKKERAKLASESVLPVWTRYAAGKKQGTFLKNSEKT